MAIRSVRSSPPLLQALLVAVAFVLGLYPSCLLFLQPMVWLPLDRPSRSKAFTARSLAGKGNNGLFTPLVNIPKTQLAADRGKSSSSKPTPFNSVWNIISPVGVGTLSTVLCPSSALLTRCLSGVLGGLAGIWILNLMRNAKLNGARSSVGELLDKHLRTGMAVEDLRASIVAARKKYSVEEGRPVAENFEDTGLRQLYEAVLQSLLENPDNNVDDLPLLQRARAALSLDMVVVGDAHARVAEMTAIRLEGGLKNADAKSKKTVDKLLFLCERMFAEADSEEAQEFEMKRVRTALKVRVKDAQQRIHDVSCALYEQALSKVAGQVSATTAAALAEHSAAFGMSEELASKMNAETYGKIAADVLQGGELTDEGRSTLAKARGVLQISEKVADIAFMSVAGPKFQEMLEEIASKFREEIQRSRQAVPPAELGEPVSKLKSRAQILGLDDAKLGKLSSKGFSQVLRGVYAEACKAASANKESQAVDLLDELAALAATAESVMSEVRTADAVDEASRPTVTADATAGGRLFALYFERELRGGTPSTAVVPDEIAVLLELPEDVVTEAKVKAASPKLRELYDAAIESVRKEIEKKAKPADEEEEEKAVEEEEEAKEEKPGVEEAVVVGAEAEEEAEPFSKLQLDADVRKLGLPYDIEKEIAMDAYKDLLQTMSGKILSSTEKEILDESLNAIDLTDDDVRRLHVQAFGPVYEHSATEALGRAEVVPAANLEALSTLRERLGLLEKEGKAILLGVLQSRVNEMMEPVQEAWEETTYTKEALQQIWKERGKDPGDDPSADGTGGDMGIQAEVPVDNVRGYKLMVEWVKLVDFYLSCNVLDEEADTVEESYPVTVGKSLETKNKEEMYGIFAWNAITCQDSAMREKWTEAKPHVGGILGLSAKEQDQVVQRNVSRWCSMFIKAKVEDNGQLGEEDVQILTEWAPLFFGISKEVTKGLVQTANKSMLQSKALQLLNKQRIQPDEVAKLREEVSTWDLVLKKDLELTRAQLRTLFRAEVEASLQDSELSVAQKKERVKSSADGFGLEETEAADELIDLLRTRCQGCLVNAVGDYLQGNLDRMVPEMRRFALLAEFAEATDGVELGSQWELDLTTRQRLVDACEESAVGTEDGQPSLNLALLQRVLGLQVLA